MDLQVVERSFVVRAGALVALSTAVLTASFIGLLAFVRGAIVDPGARLPVYVFCTAVVFVVALFTLEDPDDPGVPIVTTAVGVGIAAFVLAALGGEGILYATENAEALLTSQIVLYVVAAALICTALVYWAVHHWRELLE
jgi:hypothetical protein